MLNAILKGISDILGQGLKAEDPKPYLSSGKAMLDNLVGQLEAKAVKPPAPTPSPAPDPTTNAASLDQEAEAARKEFE